MAAEIITQEDLQEFKMQLLDEIRKLLAEHKPKMAKPWLKNFEVRNLLGVSSNTLQRLRVSGKLRSSKVGGVHYYRYEDIEKLMNSDAAC